MKKIVMGIAAVAMAASMFAVDISAKLRMNGSLFDMSTADGSKPTALQLKEPEGRAPWDQTGIDFTASADNVGATINLDSKGSACDYKLWVKPIDALKINFGGLDYCLNKETINYAGCINGTGSTGTAFDITAGGLTINLVLNPGYGNNWFNGKDVGDTAAYVKYGADFGTIGFAWIGTKAMDANTISLGYSGDFSGVNVFADAAFVMDNSDANKKTKNVKADAFVKGSADAFSYAAYANFDFDLKASEIASVGAKAKVSYALDGFTPFLWVEDANFVADDFAVELQPGADFNLGGASAQVYVDIKIAKTTTVSVPFLVKFAF